MLEYTKIEPPMEITTSGNNVLRGTAQGILLVVARGTDGALRTVKLFILLVPGLKGNIFSSSPQLKKALKQSENRRAHLSILNLLLFNKHGRIRSSPEWSSR